MMAETTKVAAVQLEVKLGDADANIERCERLAMDALRQGARWIMLPEFFTTGVAWKPEIARAIQPLDGAAAQFLQSFSARNQVVIGGSFLCRLNDGRVRNRYLCFAGGELVGRHDKDLPTMWENAFYEGGDPFDSGNLGTFGGIRIGAAVCWEFMRTMTARRLRGQVDVVIGGSCWWSVPTNWPQWLQRRWEPPNRLNSLAALQDSARLIGAPVIHAAHCGEIACPMPGLPMQYRGFFEGNAAVIGADGEVIAIRGPAKGEGIVCAELALGSRPPAMEIPDRFWLRSRGPLPVFAWHQQRWWGRRWYRRHVRGSGSPDRSLVRPD